jgi:Mg2+/Co2+ transporter CorB
MNAENALIALTISAIVSQFVNHWMLSKGALKVHHWLTIFVMIQIICVDTILALKEPDQIVMLLFNIVNVWILLMATKGLFRIKKEEKQIKK